MDVGMDRTIALLRQNDPSQKYVFINLTEETVDAAPVQELAQALEENDYVNEIHLKFTTLHPPPPPQQQQQQHRLGDLLRVLATRQKLETVRFSTPRERRGFAPNRRTRRNSRITEVHAMILRAVRENPRVQALELERCNFGVGEIDGGELISSLLDTASSPLKKIRLTACGMTTQVEETIKASLQRNTNLRKLTLDFGSLTPILQGLETNTHLQVLSLRGRQRFGQETSLAIQRLLERTTSIWCFELHRPPDFENTYSFTEESLEPICQGLIRNSTVSKVVFRSCRFADLACANLVGQMIETKPNLQFLRIEDCSFPPLSQGHLRDSLSAVLLRPNSSLRTLEWDEDSFSRDLTVGALLSAVGRSALLSAVGRSALERFSIEGINSEERFQTLLSGLPVMKIRELEFRVDWRVAENRQGDVLFAVKQNFCLRALKGTLSDGRSFFNDDDENWLQFYFDRNERLEQWVANPDTVPSLLWPDALGLALDAGADPFYRGLQAVLGNEDEPALGERARRIEEDEAA